jgi:hypothetical protein
MWPPSHPCGVRTLALASAPSSFGRGPHPRPVAYLPSAAVFSYRAVATDLAGAPGHSVPQPLRVCWTLLRSRGGSNPSRRPCTRDCRGGEPPHLSNHGTVLVMEPAACERWGRLVASETVCPAAVVFPHSRPNADCLPVTIYQKTPRSGLQILESLERRRPDASVCVPRGTPAYNAWVTVFRRR